MRAKEFLNEARVEYDKKTGRMGINHDDPDQRHGLYLNGKLVKTYDTREQAENMKKRSPMYKDATIKKIAESKVGKDKEAEFRLNHEIDKQEDDTTDYGMVSMGKEWAGYHSHKRKRHADDEEDTTPRKSKKVSEATQFGSKQEVIDHFVRQGKSAAAGAAAWERGYRGGAPKKKKELKPAPRSYHDDLDDKRYGETNESFEEQFCPDCGGSLAEAGKASRSLCLSSKPNNELGASQLSSCKSQGLRARETNKKHTIANKRVKIKGKKVRGHEYGGPLPYNKSDKTK